MPFMDETHIVVRIKTSDGTYLELPIARCGYVPPDGDTDAYAALELYQAPPDTEAAQIVEHMTDAARLLRHYEHPATAAELDRAIAWISAQEDRTAEERIAF